jgi:hypothetical protein
MPVVELLTIARGEDERERRASSSQKYRCGDSRPRLSVERSSTGLGFAMRVGLRNPESLDSLPFGGDEEFLRPIVILDAKHIRLATDLTILDIALAASSGLVHGSRIPFSAGRALETGFHGVGESTPQ